MSLPGSVSLATIGHYCVSLPGAMIPGSVTGIDQNHTSVLLVLLLSQGQRVPLLGLQREEAGAQLAAPAPAQPSE